MAQTQSQTPLWLDIKTEYIDENFEKVLNYLHQGSSEKNSQDSFYKTTISLLSQRVIELMEQIAAKPIYQDEEFKTDNASLKFETRLLASYLLISENSDSSLNKRVYFTMLSTLSKLLPSDYSRDVIKYAINCITSTCEGKYPFSWQDLLDFQPQLFAYKIVNDKKRISKNSKPECYDNKGSISINDGVFTIASSNRAIAAKMNLVPSISIMDDKIQVLSQKDEKVKKSESADIEVLEAFTRNFVMDQRHVTVVSKKKAVKTYCEGDVFKVIVTGFDDDIICVESADEEYAFKGYVDFSQSLLFYDCKAFAQYFPIGELIKVKLVDENHNICSIEDEFSKYMVEEVAKPDIGKEVLAVFFTEVEQKNGVKTVWFTDTGYPAYTFSAEGFSKGDFAYINILKHGENNFYSYITAKIVEKTTDFFDLEDARRKCIEDFSYGKVEKKEAKDTFLYSGTVKELCRMLVQYQHSLAKPSERYRILSTARFLAEMTGNTADSSYIKFVSDYLEDLVLFAKGEIDKIQSLVPDSDVAELESVTRRMSIVDILKAYGTDSYDDELNAIIQEENDPLLTKIAILVQSCNRIDDVISKSMQNVVKREIIKSLSLETEGDTDLEEENGIYLGLESNRQEFKTSFFHAPADAKEQNQKVNVFKGICAFLNSQVGGTLFLGVDDLGYVKGLESDLSYMEKTAYGNYHGIDGYIRFITDEAKKYFELGVLTHIEIKSMYDGKVVAMNVTPYEYKVVTLNDIAYIRLNNESVVMNEAMKRELMAKRVFTNKEKAANVATLQEAIKEKRKVIFHGYRSSNSGEIKAERNMEPFAFSSGYSHVWCYDLDKQKVSVFRADRIRSVEITEKGWEYEKQHKQGNMDAFHMTGDKPIRVILQLDLMAQNLLIEEFPEAKPSISATDDDNKWILDINVYKIEGIGRFYIGLAGDIEIIDAPELKEYVQKYTKEYLG